MSGLARGSLIAFFVVCVFGLIALAYIRQVTLTRARIREATAERPVVQRLFNEIMQPRNTVRTSTGVGAETPYVFLGASYKTALSNSEVTKFYATELAAHGWRPCSRFRHLIFSDLFPPGFGFDVHFYRQGPYEWRVVNFKDHSGEYDVAVTWGSQHCIADA